MRAMVKDEYNPRYLEYCRARGAGGPGETLDADTSRWPGGKMCGSMLWTRQRWTEWLKLSGANREFLSEADHAAFDAWLAARTVQPHETE